MLLALWPSPGWTHDASAWGGLFRSRDYGLTWFQANQGRPVGGALAIAVDPLDSTHLLLGTDAGLLASRNGGLDWEQQAPNTLIGPILAVAFDPAGVRVLAATEHALFRTDDGLYWQPSPTPAGVTPVRAIVPDGHAGHAYLLGWQRILRTYDWGASWDAVGADMPDAPVTALVVAGGELFAVVAGEVWASSDDGSSWQPRQIGLPAGSVQTLGTSADHNSTVCAAGADQVFRSTDLGLSWSPVGKRLADSDTEIRALAADAAGSELVLSTHRGLYASQDGGGTWNLLADNLPGHLEAGPLIYDPKQPGMVYAGFSLLPYGEQWARAANGRSAGSQLSLTELTGATAFLALLALAAGWTLRWLARTRTEPVQA